MTSLKCSADTQLFEDKSNGESSARANDSVQFFLMPKVKEHKTYCQTAHSSTETHYIVCFTEKFFTVIHENEMHKDITRTVLPYVIYV